jgi:hypothetical protein
VRPAAPGDRAIARLLTAALLALVALTGCGNDAKVDSSPARPTTSTTSTQPRPTTAPARTTPSIDPRTVPEAPGEGNGRPPAGNGGTGGTPAPGGSGGSGGTPAPPAQDSPGNDTPPPPGSPAQRFEQYCNAHPGACG